MSLWYRYEKSTNMEFFFVQTLEGYENRHNFDVSHRAKTWRFAEISLQQNVAAYSVKFNITLLSIHPFVLPCFWHSIPSHPSIYPNQPFQPTNQPTIHFNQTTISTNQLPISTNQSSQPTNQPINHLNQPTISTNQLINQSTIHLIQPTNQPASQPACLTACLSIHYIPSIYPPNHPSI